MFWSLLFTLGGVVSTAVGQSKYGPYKGPPVVPVILPGGFLADTQEVAALKEYHLKALAKTAEQVKDDGRKGYYNPRPYKSEAPRYQQQSKKPLYHLEDQKPLYQPVYKKPQHFRYTKPQVYQAPNPYRAEPTTRPAPVYEDTPAQTYDEGDYQDELQYVATSPRPDPQVTPVILANGYIADTQEVDAAKQEHFALVAKAQEAVAQAAQRASQQRATAGYVAPAAAHREPSGAYREAAGAYRQPASAYREPAAAYREPAAAYREPAAVYREPAAAYREPAGAYREAAHQAPASGAEGYTDY